MERLDFPIITPDWTAREELSLLEGIETFGIGNWVEVTRKPQPSIGGDSFCTPKTRVQI